MDLKALPTEELLNELAKRCSKKAEEIATWDLLDELASRRGVVDTTVVDPYETIRLCVTGPAVILTVFE